jgi:predicted secreted protein
MAKQNGTLVKLLIKRKDESTFTFVGAAQGDSFSISVDLPDATTKGSAGWAEHIQGLRSASGSISGLHDPTESFTEEEVYEMIYNRETAIMQYGTLEAGSKYFEFEASISNFTKNTDAEQPVSFDFDYQVNGKVELKTATS